MVGVARALGLVARGAFPEGAGGADERRAFEDEARESNARTLRWLTCGLAPLHVIAVLVFFRGPERETDPARATWIFWMVRLHAMEAVVGLLAPIVAWRGRPAAR